jgi:hypothetical protein
MMRTLSACTVLSALAAAAGADDVDAWYLVKLEDKAVGYMHVVRKDLPAENSVEFSLEFTQKKGERLGRERFRQWSRPDRWLTPTRILIGEIGSTEPPRLDVKRDGDFLRGFRAGERASLRCAGATVAEPALMEVIRTLPNDAGASYEFTVLKTLSFQTDPFHKVAHAAVEDVEFAGRRVGVSRFEHFKSQEKLGTYYVSNDRRLLLVKRGKIEIALSTEKDARALFGE